jgi:hypothetical protein
MKFDWKNRYLNISEIYTDISLFNSLKSFSGIIYLIVFVLFFWTLIWNYPLGGTITLVGFLTIFFGPGIRSCVREYRYKKSNGLFPTQKEIDSSNLYFSDLEKVDAALEKFDNILEAENIISVKNKSMKRLIFELKKKDIYANKSMKPRLADSIIEDLEECRQMIDAQSERKKTLEKRLFILLNSVSGKTSIEIPSEILKKYPNLK